MLPGSASFVRRLFGTQEQLISQIARLSKREEDFIREEVISHLALRVAFLLIGEIAGSSNYRVLRKRLADTLPGHDDARINELAQELSKALVAIESSSVAPKAGLSDIPYPTRRALFERQHQRCAVCGWHFRKTDDLAPRTDWETTPCLDHKVPHRLGGDLPENLWITCALCNTMKEASLHIGEHGRVWSGNHVFRHQPRAVAFWAMMRDGRCGELNCGRGPEQERLFVERVSVRGAWIVDNCQVRCFQHLSSGLSNTAVY